MGMMMMNRVMMSRASLLNDFSRQGKQLKKGEKRRKK